MYGDRVIMPSRNSFHLADVRWDVALTIVVLTPAGDAPVLRVERDGETVTDREHWHTTTERRILRRLNPLRAATRSGALCCKPAARKGDAPRVAGSHGFNPSKRLRHIALAFVVLSPRDERIRTLRECGGSEAKRECEGNTSDSA